MKKEQATKSILAFLGALAFAFPLQAGEIDKLNTFYFGNSFLGNAMPGLHPELVKKSGKTWKQKALISPGVPIPFHAVQQMDPKSNNHKAFQQEGPDVDAIVMLQFGGFGLGHVTDQMWGGKYKFDKPTDIGDVASCATIIREYLKMNPEGRACVYAPWVSGGAALKDFRERVTQEVKLSFENPNVGRKALMRKVKEEMAKKNIEPLLEKFDYEDAYLAEDYVPNWTSDDVRGRLRKYVKAIEDPKKDADWKLTAENLAAAAETKPEQVADDLQEIGITVEQLKSDPDAQSLLSRYADRSYRTHSRQHHHALLEALTKEFPEMWNEKRLGMIPVGDVMLALHQKLQEGAMPPLKSVAQLAPGHMRSGLGRYLLGATFYAVLFKDHPKNIDWQVYQDIGNYESKKFGYYVHQPDLGKHIDITPERAAILNDIIWDVVKNHPYTQVK